MGWRTSALRFCTDLLEVSCFYKAAAGAKYLVSPLCRAHRTHNRQRATEQHPPDASVVLVSVPSPPAPPLPECA
eukprot:366298-Chlamydomonas_euryale.AAC.1